MKDYGVSRCIGLSKKGSCGKNLKKLENFFNKTVLNGKPIVMVECDMVYCGEDHEAVKFTWYVDDEEGTKTSEGEYLEKSITAIDAFSFFSNDPEIVDIQHETLKELQDFNKWNDDQCKIADIKLNCEIKNNKKSWTIIFGVLVQNI